MTLFNRRINYKFDSIPVKIKSVEHLKELSQGVRNEFGSIFEVWLENEVWEVDMDPNGKVTISQTDPDGYEITDESTYTFDSIEKMCEKIGIGNAYFEAVEMYGT